jgi:GNAT superfamily N-acetyltransferase
MRETLIEVVGHERGTSMYTMDWLIQRVLFHLDPNQSTAQVYVSESLDGQINGHCIVRKEIDEQGVPYGLFSTTYVEPQCRRLGIANSLLVQGEEWMRGLGLTVAATATSKTNKKLINMYFKHDYKIVVTTDEMVRLEKQLVPTMQVIGSTE